MFKLPQMRVRKVISWRIGEEVMMKKELEELIKEAVECAKRNGKPDDPEQKKAIKKAYHVASQLINGTHYSEAVTILEPLCNMTMGPLKAKAAYAIVKLFATKGQFRLVRDIVTHVAKLSGESKVILAEKCAYWLMVYHHLDDARRLQAVLENHEQDYGQEAAKRIASFITLATSQASDVTEALSKVKSDPALAEKVALKYGVRNGKPEEAEQIQALNMTVQLVTVLMDNDQFDHVYRVLDGLCNMTMGLLKSEAICLMTHRYIEKGQPKYAKEIAEKAASLKGKIKAKIAEMIALDLIEHDYIEEARSILKVLEQGDKDASKNSVATLQKALRTYGEFATNTVSFDQIRQDPLRDQSQKASSASSVEAASSQKTVPDIHTIQKQIKQFLTAFEPGTLEFITKKKEPVPFVFTVDDQHMDVKMTKESKKIQYHYRLTSGRLTRDKVDVDQEEFPSFIRLLSTIFKAIGDDKTVYKVLSSNQKEGI